MKSLTDDFQLVGVELVSLEEGGFGFGVFGSQKFYVFLIDNFGLFELGLVLVGFNVLVIHNY